MVALSHAVIGRNIAYQGTSSGLEVAPQKASYDGTLVFSFTMALGKELSGHGRDRKCFGIVQIPVTEHSGLRHPQRRPFGGVDGAVSFSSHTFWDAEAGLRPSMECRAAGGKGTAARGQPAPEDEDPERRNPIGSESPSAAHSQRDWRTFRAQLVAMEREEEQRAREGRDEGEGQEGEGPGSSVGLGLGLGLGVSPGPRADGGRSKDTEAGVLRREGREEGEEREVASGGNCGVERDCREEGSYSGRREVGKRWAHPLPGLERGCILVATELLDGYAFFERSVILLLSTGEHEAPYGLVLNKLHTQRVGNIAGMSRGLATTFGPCRVNIGGPIDDQRFLLLHSIKELHGFDEVVPGTYYGGAAGMEAAVSLVQRQLARPEDFRFFFGYAGWDAVQLRNEINLGWWHVAACSTDIVLKEAEGDLWEEVMRLMGETYAEAG